LSCDRCFAQIFEEESPAGQTPLCHHIGEVIEQIKAQEDELRATGRKACVVIATDGESTDGNLADAMRPLQHLPVWVVSVTSLFETICDVMVTTMTDCDW
jgi:chloramphenicol 3-O-phosphotransferase